MISYKFNIGDLLKVSRESGAECFCSPYDRSKEYRDNLKVVFQFWDGMKKMYVVTAEDGVGLVVDEDSVELQDSGQDRLRQIEKNLAGMPRREAPDGEVTEERYSMTRQEVIDLARRATFRLDDHPVPFDRETLRAESWLAGYEFAKDHERKEEKGV